MRRQRALRVAIVVVGLVLEQCILFGPSLIGRKILLPLDLLASYYLPNRAEYRDIVPGDGALTDLVVHSDPFRRFAASEFRAGRVPLWNPYIFAGVPFANVWKYSPFLLLYYLLPSPVTLAWMQLIKSVLAGLGAYLFFRRVLHVHFWPAAIGAWCYPLTGFFVLWQGFELPSVIAWYPWVLLCTDSAIQRPWGYGGPGLAVVTALAILSGVSDLAAQVLLASAFYAAWRLIGLHGRRVFSRPALTAAAVAICAWSLGCCLAAPYALPLADYLRESRRIGNRAAGSAEFTPIGVTALPEVILPRIYGTTEKGSMRIAPPELLLTTAAVAYSGLLATLLVAPLAWCSRRHRSLNTFWVVSGVASISWFLNIPGLAAVFRLPILNIFSHYRWGFVAAFATLALAVTGLEVLWEGHLRRRWWFVVPAAIAATFGSWCCYRSVHLPEPVATQIRIGVQTGHPIAPARDLTTVEQIQHTFRRTYIEGAVLCGLAVAGWLLLWSTTTRRRWFGLALGALLVAELLWFAYGTSPQSDPRLYYPRISVLEKLALAAPGRIVGARALWPDLNMTHGLRDIRGYDGVDPARYIELLDIARDKRFPSPFYASTQWYFPTLRLAPGGQVRLSPVLDMLNVRYIIFRGTPPTGVTPLLQDEGYWVLENSNVLPRAYVPRRVETVADAAQTLRKLAAPGFDPRQVAYVDRPVRLPVEAGGSAEIVDEVPSQVTVSADMQTAGLVVLADRWDKGWRVSVNGAPAPLLRANYALRGVQVPAGRSRLVFSYTPASVTWSVRIMCVGLAGVLLWAGVSGSSPSRGLFSRGPGR